MVVRGTFGALVAIQECIQECITKTQEAVLRVATCILFYDTRTGSVHSSALSRTEFSNIHLECVHQQILGVDGELVSIQHAKLSRGKKKSVPRVSLLPCVCEGMTADTERTYYDVHVTPTTYTPLLVDVHRTPKMSNPLCSEYET